MARCKSCGAQIVWIRTPDFKWMPCNEGLVPYKQDDEGEDYVVTDRGETIKCTFEFECLPTGMARIPHWATCPDAKKYKEKGRGKANGKSS